MNKLRLVFLLGFLFCVQQTTYADDPPEVCQCPEGFQPACDPMPTEGNCTPEALEACCEPIPAIPLTNFTAMSLLIAMGLCLATLSLQRSVFWVEGPNS